MLASDVYPLLGRFEVAEFVCFGLIGVKVINKISDLQIYSLFCTKVDFSREVSINHLRTRNRLAYDPIHADNRNSFGHP